MKKLVITAVLTATSVIFAAEGPKTPAAKGGDTTSMTPEQVQQMREAQKERFRRATGGKVEKPGSCKGVIAIVDCQSQVAATNFAVAAETFTYQTKYDLRVLKHAPGDVQAVKADVGADIAVVVVEDDKTPPMLVAPEEGWALVNVNRLKGNLPKGILGRAVLAGRMRKQIIRAFTIVCGGFSSSYRGNVLSAVKPEDLDLSREEVPFDTIQAMRLYLKDLGITEHVYKPYFIACREGWAPQPTNEYQKAIWDKVHQLPTKPIKILPETKPVKE